MKVSQEGSVRVDLLGGTLDLYPINLIIPNVLTLNCATSLVANVVIESNGSSDIIFDSKDYNLVKTFELDRLLRDNYSLSDYGPLEFLVRILQEFPVEEGITITMSSKAPAGSGLGGSSTMGCVFYAAFCRYLKLELDKIRAIEIIQRIESRILNSGPAGYQDYYPSLFGGILSLSPDFRGVSVEQLYSREFADFLSNHARLIYSRESRLSGINNWEVYKSFFDKDQKTIDGLNEIAKLTFSAYEYIQQKNFFQFLECLCQEGRVRESLFPGIMTDKMKGFKKDAVNEIGGFMGVKVCGAGGGGCFLLVAKDFSGLPDLLSRHEMELLPFSILGPKEEMG